MVKNDSWIRKMAQKGMIDPFNEGQVGSGVISFGIGSYGYDMRIYDEFKVLNAVSGTVLDPKNVRDKDFVDYKGAVCEVRGNAFVICRSLEYFRIPRDVLAVCFGKSTYARSGVIVNVTPLEPEWEGYVTIAVSNTAPVPVRLYANEGIAQIVFLEASELCETSYADKKGKYQAQKGIVLPKI
jgi:dCTP deaminase